MGYEVREWKVQSMRYEVGKCDVSAACESTARGKLPYLIETCHDSRRRAGSTAQARPHRGSMRSGPMTFGCGGGGCGGVQYSTVLYYCPDGTFWRLHPSSFTGHINQRKAVANPDDAVALAASPNCHATWSCINTSCALRSRLFFFSS